MYSWTTYSRFDHDPLATSHSVELCLFVSHSIRTCNRLIGIPFGKFQLRVWKV